MKYVLVLVLGIAAAVASAGETKMSIVGPDGLTGTAKLENKVQDDGSKYVRLEMQLSFADGQNSEVLQESSYSAKGEPQRMLQTVKRNGKKTSIVVTFTPEGAQVMADRGTGPQTNMVISPVDGQTANPSEFWFSGVVPRVGQAVEFSVFKVSEQAWAKTKAKYVGDQDLVVAKKRVRAHLVVIGDAKTYLDDKGDPYRIEMGSLVMERIGD